jgi:hypothetical protein
MPSAFLCVAARISRSEFSDLVCGANAIIVVVPPATADLVPDNRNQHRVTAQWWRYADRSRRCLSFFPSHQRGPALRDVHDSLSRLATGRLSQVFSGIS